jgi:predicted outer membrane repeat protein
MQSTNQFMLPLFIAVLLVLPAAEAATRFVDGTSGSDASDCLSAASPCLTVGRALDVAQAGDLIDIADAIYTEVLEVGQSLTLQGESRAGTIIQADSEPFQGNYDINDDRVITVTGGGELVIQNLTIRHGVSPQGGGMDIDGVDLILENVIFDRNGSGNTGGALRTRNNSVTMNGVVFIGNLAGQPDGGSSGGAINGRDCDLTLTNVRFEANEAGSGGALFFRNVTGTFEDVDFIGNSAEGEGGAVALRSSSPEFLNVSFRGNSAGGSGGATYTVFDSAPTLTNVLIAGNSAGSFGGGINFQSGSSQTRVFTNVTITGNRAVSSRGGGIFNPGDLELRNTIIWNNSDINGQGSPTSSISDFSSGSPPTSDFSLVQGYGASEFPGSGALDGTDPANAPQFVTPVSPVGAPSLFGNLRLGENSPLINVGSNGFVTGVSTDLDGFSRINDGIVDLGPYETGNDGLFQDRFEN